MKIKSAALLVMTLAFISSATFASLPVQSDMAAAHNDKGSNGPHKGDRNPKG